LDTKSVIIHNFYYETNSPLLVFVHTRTFYCKILKLETKAIYNIQVDANFTLQIYFVK